MDYILSENFDPNNLPPNLYDYATGVEVGLDSNGRKNRGGHQMENLVEKFLIEASVEYFTEKYDSDFEKSVRARPHNDFCESNFDQTL